MVSSHRTMLTCGAFAMLILTGLGCTTNSIPCRTLTLNSNSLPVAAIIPIGPSEVYVVHTDGLIDDYRTKVAVLEKVSITSDKGSLENAIRLRGEYRSHSITQESVCIAVESYTEPLSFSNSITSIYRISLKDGDTTRLCAFDGVLLRNLWFSKDGQHASVLLRLSNKESDLLWATSSDGGITWSRFPMTERMDIVQLDDTVLYSSVTELHSKQSLVTELLLDGDVRRSIRVPMAIAAFSVPRSSEQGVLCVGSDDDGLVVRTTIGDSTALLHRFELGGGYFAKDIYRFGGLIAVTLGRSDTQMLSGHGGVRYEMHVSTDFGTTWHALNPYEQEMYSAVTGYYHSDWIMRSSSSGDLFLCTP